MKVGYDCSSNGTWEYNGDGVHTWIPPLIVFDFINYEKIQEEEEDKKRFPLFHLPKS